MYINMYNNKFIIIDNIYIFKYISIYKYVYYTIFIYIYNNVYYNNISVNNDSKDKFWDIY